MRIIIVLFVFFSWNINASEIKLTDIRVLFKKSATDENACKKLMTSIGTSNHTTLLAYKACATMIMAKYSFSPFSKLSYFNEGKVLLEKSIGQEPTNIEARFLRFTVQTSSPGFLGYNKLIQVDKAFLMKSIQTLSDLELKKMVTSYLQNSTYLSEVEKQSLKL